MEDPHVAIRAARRGPIISTAQTSAYCLNRTLIKRGRAFERGVMNITRMYTGTDGRSHFEDIALPFDPISDAQRTETVGAIGVQFVLQPPGFVIDLHPAPRRQYVVTLQGQAEIEMGDGEVRRFGPGDVVLADDLTGEGHITRIVGDVPRVTAQVTLGD